MAVVVQGMVDACKAGVMFTRSPQTGDRSVVTIEAAWGLGSSVVSGEVTPDRLGWLRSPAKFLSARSTTSTSSICRRQTAEWANVETPEEMRRAAVPERRRNSVARDVARKIERHYGRPQDIEWAIDHSGRILLLQSRPETVWSAKQSAPVARPAEHPMQHVMRIFGGRAVTLTAKDVQEIMRLLESVEFDSLSLEMNGVKLHLERRLDCGAAPRNLRPPLDPAPNLCRRWRTSGQEDQAGIRSRSRGRCVSTAWYVLPGAKTRQTAIR